jgi:hypothetical protein
MGSLKNLQEQPKEEKGGITSTSPAAQQQKQNLYINNYLGARVRYTTNP